MNQGFLTLVERMRDLQKTFFRTRYEDRTPQLLSDCKAAEKAVDEHIKRVRSAQGELFGDEL